MSNTCLSLSGSNVVPITPVKSKFPVKVRGMNFICHVMVEREPGLGWYIEDHELYTEEGNLANWMLCRLTDDDIDEIDQQIANQLN